MNATSKGSKSPWFVRLREFRFLAGILAAWGGLAVYEISRQDLPKSAAEVRPEWLLDEQLNLSKTLLELYPNRSMGYFMRSYQAGMCFDQGFQLPICQGFTHKSVQDVREALEAALAHGGASNQEEMFHFYAVILATQGEPAEKVEQAVGQWRRHFPYSTKPDPRTLVQTQQP